MSDQQQPPESDGDDLMTNALDELTRGIRERVGQGENDIDWFELFDELRDRFGNIGMADRSGDVDDFGLDPELLRSWAPLLRFLRERWWRIDIRGGETLPPEGPALFVANRAGLLPYDGLMISDAVARLRGPEHRPRFLIADWLITLPFVQSTVARLGGVRACRENAERLLGDAQSVVAFPEGQKGAAKVFAERYRVQRFGRGGVVRLALEAGVPLVPVAVVGSEEVHPVLFKLETAARAVGLPFVPVTPTFPWLGPLGAIPLPSKWSITFGRPLPPPPEASVAAQDDLLVTRITEEIRDEIQRLVDDAVRTREGVFGSGGS